MVVFCILSSYQLGPGVPELSFLRFHVLWDWCWGLRGWKPAKMALVTISQIPSALHPSNLLTWLPVVQLFQCPISHEFTALASVCSFPPVITYPYVTWKNFIIFKMSILLPRLELVNEFKKKKIYWGYTQPQRQRHKSDDNRISQAIKKSLCGGNVLDLYQQWCPSPQTFFQKADVTDLRDEEHKAPFQMLPWYFFNIEVWVYLETSSRATLYI